MKVKGGRLLEARLQQAANDVPKVMEARVRHFGQLLLSRVKANAATGFHKPGMGHIPGTGPGPNVATGDYLRSIGMDMTSSGNEATAEVGTNKVQGRRLEFGFVGTDSAGRTYPSSSRTVRGRRGSPLARKGYPYPHFLPALRVIQPQYLAAMRKIIEDATK